MYFSSFPITIYDAVGNGQSKFVTHLLKRVAVRAKTLASGALYDTYDVRNGETPEMIAHKMYGSTEYHWVVLLLNNITDRYHQWPMDTRQFLAHINDKYTNVDATHHYEVYQKSGDTSIKINVGTTATDYGASVETFNPSSDVDGEYITTTTVHTFSVGDTVSYSSVGGTKFPELEENGKYFIRSVGEDIVLDNVDSDFERIILNGTDASSTNDGSKIRLEGGDSSDSTLLNETSPIHGLHTGDAVIAEDGNPLVGEDTDTLFKIANTSGGGPISLSVGSDELHAFTKIIDVAVPITNREYEEDLQDQLRKIKLLDSAYLDQFETEFKEMINRDIF